jgi:transposase
MEKFNTISIDLAKSVFQVAIINHKGKVLSNRKIARKKLMDLIANQPCSLIVMESCGSSNYWGRKFQELGHKVKLISAQHVKPFVKSNKNDANDAIAIYEASQRPKMKFVSIKTLEQQDIQSIHRSRQRLVDTRTGLVNHARGLLAEYGLVFKMGIASLREGLASIINANESYSDEITHAITSLAQGWYEELIALDQAIDKINRTIKNIARQSEQAKRLMQIEGIGFITATAMVAALGTQSSEFKNGREMAAYLGLTPRQFSSGGKSKLRGISKRGDTYLRTLLVNGATSVINALGTKTDPKSQWVHQLLCRMHKSKARVALANKMARICWVILAKGKTYQPELASARMASA